MYSNYAQILYICVYVYVWLCDYMWLYVIIYAHFYVDDMAFKWGGSLGFTGMILNDCLWCILHPPWNPSDPQKLDRNLLMLLVKSPIDECLSHHFSSRKPSPCMAGVIFHLVTLLSELGKCLGDLGVMVYGETMGPTGVFHFKKVPFVQSRLWISLAS